MVLVYGISHVLSCLNTSSLNTPSPRTECLSVNYALQGQWVWYRSDWKDRSLAAPELHSYTQAGCHSCTKARKLPCHLKLQQPASALNVHRTIAQTPECETTHDGIHFEAGCCPISCKCNDVNATWVAMGT